MKIALVQSPLAWGELQENLQNFDKKMAKSEDCDVILLPEMFTSGCMMIKKSAEVAFAAKESVANAYPVVEEKMLAWAKRQHALVMGSTVYRENGKTGGSSQTGKGQMNGNMTNGIVSEWAGRTSILLPETGS